jgi:1,2-diacylglycerol 3-beta-glucosyltransferase
MVASEKASRSQRERWEGGRAQFAREHGPGLLIESLRTGDRVRLDLALDLLVPPLATLATLALALSALGGAAFALEWISACVALAAATPFALLLLYVGRGVMLSGLGARGWWVLAAAPAYVLWKVGLKLRGKPRGEEWVRTQRETQEPPR